MWRESSKLDFMHYSIASKFLNLNTMIPFIKPSNMPSHSQERLKQLIQQIYPRDSNPQLTCKKLHQNSTLEPTWASSFSHDSSSQVSSQPLSHKSQQDSHLNDFKLQNNYKSDFRLATSHPQSISESSSSRILVHPTHTSNSSSSFPLNSSQQPQLCQGHSQQQSRQCHSNSRTMSSQHSLFGNVPEAPVDPILSMTQRYKEDKDSRKVNLGVGAYRDDNNRPFVLRAVREAEDSLVAERLDKEYVPQDGNKKFSAEAIKLMYGKKLVSSLGDRIAALQTISGTGALCVGFNFLGKFVGIDRPIYFPNPTWGNHQKLAGQVGFKNICSYRYYDAKTHGLDIQGMLKDINDAPAGSIIVLHLCAHNPTGVDPTEDQWKEIYNVIALRGHIPFFDSAYQGFASGDLDRDAFAVRYFVSQGLEVFTAQSFAKNMGMYGERVGCLSVVVSNPELASNTLSQLKTIVRALYSSPPLHGARIVERVLTNEKLYNLWIEDLVQMSDRIKDMRTQLYNRLSDLKTPGDWKHIVNQIGMFSYTGLSVQQSNRMIEKHHIYMLTNGRISMAGLNSKNIDYVAKAIHDCVSEI